MSKLQLAVLLAVIVVLAGCVYEQSATRESAPPLPAARPTPTMQAAAPDRVRTEDLSRLSPGTGVAGPEAEPYRHARRTPEPARIFVQAASFVTREEAERTRRSVAELGRAGVYTAYVEAQLRYRVRIGPLASPERSERVRAALVSRGYGDAIIIRD